MTDVINGKNRKPSASNKVVLPIFTQRLSGYSDTFFQKNLIKQND